MKIKNYKLEDIYIGRDFFEKKANKTYKIFIYFFIILIMSVFIWSSFSKVELKIKGIGVIENIYNESIIQTSISGKISESNLVTGRKIKKGDILLKIDDTYILEQYDNLNKKLEESVNFLNYLNDRKYNLDSNVVNYKIDENSIDLKIKTENLNIDKASKKYKDFQKIYSVGGISKNEVLENKRIYLNSKINSDILLNQKQNIKLIKKKELENEIERLKLELTKLGKILEQYKVISPINGTIEAIRHINVGDMIGNEVVARIVPDKTSFQSKIYIKEKDISKIDIKDKVILKIKDKGEIRNLNGRILYISNEKIKFNDEMYYYLLVNIQNRNNLKLKNGMIVDASIIYSTKTVFEYFKDLLIK